MDIIFPCTYAISTTLLSTLHSTHSLNSNQIANAWSMSESAYTTICSIQISNLNDLELCNTHLYVVEICWNAFSFTTSCLINTLMRMAHISPKKKKKNKKNICITLTHCCQMRDTDKLLLQLVSHYKCLRKSYNNSPIHNTL